MDRASDIVYGLQKVKMTEWLKVYMHSSSGLKLTNEANINNLFKLQSNTNLFKCQSSWLAQLFFFFLNSTYSYYST